MSAVWRGLISAFHKILVKYRAQVGFIGTGVIAQAMARGAACVHEFDEAFAYGLDTAMTQKFADELQAELGYKVYPVVQSGIMLTSDSS